MNNKTHVAFGIFFSLLLFRVVHIENPALFVIIASFFALLPDIDQSRSKVVMKVRPLSLVLKHRGLMHSIWIPMILILVVYPISFDISLAIFIGYFSHLLTDGFTKRGVKFIWPIGWKTKGYVTTGGKMEHTILMLISLLIFWLVL